MTFDEAIKKYPVLADELEVARALQENASSMQGKAIYKQRQKEVNALIPKIIEHCKIWDESQLRYTITRLEILRDELITMENNAHALDVYIGQIENGDFDPEKNEDD